MRRRNHGAPIRAAMRAAGMAIPRLAAKTKEIDPDGRGISASYIGFITGSGETAREECSDRAAQLVAGALDQEVEELFEPVVYTLRESTSTRRLATALQGDAPAELPERLMTQTELAGFLRMSKSWIDKEIQECRRRGETWPGLIYVGGRRRFDPIAVLAGQGRIRDSA
ncbi:hypothetical protein ACIOHE_15905 [Streptomyces sp. NPDC087851]|uniref:hypothetical protein n=1 Tax=Streptomyces sp. NPDC087851 TaxID=3365810 RepID=UPI0037F10A27